MFLEDILLKTRDQISPQTIPERKLSRADAVQQGMFWREKQTIQKKDDGIQKSQVIGSRISLHVKDKRHSFEFSNVNVLSEETRVV